MSYVDDVKLAAGGQWKDILIQVAGIPADLLDGKHHHCPKCPDRGKDRFRLLKEKDGAVICNRCFSEKNGDGIAAVQWMRDVKFGEAVELIGNYLGVKRKRRGIAARFDFRDWDDAFALGWCAEKGIDIKTVRENGGRLATWKSAGHGEFMVIAWPIVFEYGKAAKNWVMVSAAGGKLPIKSGDQKKLLVAGKEKGWIGSWALKHAAKAKYIWKVEGPTDMLALWQAIPEPLRTDHVVITNPFGSKEKPLPGHLKLFKNKVVIVCHDGDIDGRMGADRWSKGAATVAERVRVIDMPDGEDLRGWLSQGRQFSDLVELAKQSTPLERPEQPADSSNDDDIGIDLADDDPFRLGKLYIQQMVQRVAVQNGTVHYWHHGGWRIVEDTDFQADVQEFVAQEFQRLALEARDAAKNADSEPEPPMKTTAPIISQVCQAIRNASCISAPLEYGTMLERDPVIGRATSGERRDMVSMENGLLSFRTTDGLLQEEMLEHTADWWSLVRLPYSYNPSASLGDYWLRFLVENIGQDDDIRMLQQWLGYLLLPDTAQQKFLVLHGSGGNGKSVLCGVIEALVGSENVSAVPLESFGEPFALADTVGKLVNIISDAPELDKVAEGKLKEFTAGDVMRFNRKYKPSFSARPTARLVLSCNNLPRVADKSDAIWRRTVVLEFCKRVKSPIDGMTKPDFWLNHGELPGILNWAIEGLKDLRLRGKFEESERSRRAVDSWRLMTNPAREFLLDEYEASEGGFVVTGKVYAEYREWCTKNGYQPLASGQFGSQIKGTFVQSERKQKRMNDGSRQWGYEGVQKKFQIGNLN